jgi:hypothetical protein
MLTELLAALSGAYEDETDGGSGGDRAGGSDRASSSGRAGGSDHHRRSEPFDPPAFGDVIEATDYTRAEMWLNLPGVVEAPRPPSNSPSDPPSETTAPIVPLQGLDVDVFFAYPTAWRAQGGWPLAAIDNEEMRLGALYSLWVRASAFGTVGRVFAPYYRQMDAAYVASLPPARVAELFYGAPLTDMAAAFAHYLKHYNEGRPFILAGHSQGSIVLSGLLMTALAPDTPTSVSSPDVSPVSPGTPLERMVAAYLIGSTWTQAAFEAAPSLKPATRADDTGVVISYNTEAPVVDGFNPFSTPGAVTINPVSWRTDDTPAPALLSKGGIIVRRDGTFEKREHLADARINPQRGTIVCSSVDRERFSSSRASRAYFPLGVLHENDIALYYYDLRANAELRARAWYAANSPG